MRDLKEIPDRPTLAQLRADLARADREPARVGRVLGELRKTNDTARAALNRATAEYSTAIDCQAAAVSAFKADSSERRGAAVESMDRRVRLATIAKQGAEDRALEAAQAVAGGEAAKDRADREVKRLSLAVAAHVDTYRAAVEPLGRSALQHLRALLADFESVRQARTALEATLREHATDGFGPLPVPDTALDLATLLEGVLEDGRDISESTLQTLRRVSRRSATDIDNPASAPLTNPGWLIQLLVSVLADQTREAGANRGYERGRKVLELLAEVRTGATWEEAAAAHARVAAEKDVLARVAAESEAAAHPRPVPPPAIPVTNLAPLRYGIAPAAASSS